MSRKSERRARRQAINELLARHEPPSRLDALDQHGCWPADDGPGPASLATAPGPPAQRLSIPEQAGPSRSQTAAELAAPHDGEAP